jgi:hypothetical protein
MGRDNIKICVISFIIVAGAAAGLPHLMADIGISPELAEVLIKVLPQEEMNEALKKGLEGYQAKIGAKKQILPAAPTGVLVGYCVFVGVLAVCFCIS